MSFLFITSISAFILFFQASGFSASDPFFDANNYPKAEPNNIEIFDQRTGQMGFEIPIADLPGPSGLNMKIGLSFNKGSAIPGGNKVILGSTDSVAGAGIGLNTVMGVGAAQWWLEVPRLESSFWEGVVCGRKNGLVPTLILPGQSPIRLLYNDKTKSPLTSADYFSSDRRWSAKCVKGSTAQMSWAGIADNTQNFDFVVQSAEGIIYRFKRKPYLPGVTSSGAPYIPNLANYNSGQFAAGLFAGYVFVVSSIEDIFGNRIDYNYTARDLTSIVANDGRKIQLTYESATLNTRHRGSYSLTRDPMPVSRLKKVDVNGKVWTIRYKDCTQVYGADCMTNNFVDFTKGRNAVLGVLLSHVVTGLERPDGKLWNFEYDFFRMPEYGEGAYPRPGTFLQVSKITQPNGLIRSYSFQALPAAYVGGWRPTIVSDMSDGGTTFFTYLGLIKKTFSGPGMTAPQTFEYNYHVENYDTVSGTSPSKISYTFIIEPERMQVVKFRRDPKAGDLGSGYDTSVFDAGLPIEMATMPLPPGNYASLPQMPTPYTPTPPPALQITNSQPVYTAGSGITINFLSSSSTAVVMANCQIDGLAVVPCTSLSSFTIPQTLSAGLHSVVISVLDSLGKSSSQSVTFWVGSSNTASTPVITKNLVDQKVLIGRPALLSAQFSGTVTYYQWYKDNQPIVGANRSFLSIPYMDRLAAGRYYLAAYNGEAVSLTSVMTLGLDMSAFLPLINSLMDDE